MDLATSTTLRVFLGQEAAHYDGGLVAGSRVLGLFGDAGTELMLQRDGVEGLLACYRDVQFLAPIFAGSTLDVTAEITKVGVTSRVLRFEASVDGLPVCTAEAVAIAKPLSPPTGS